MIFDNNKNSNKIMVKRFFMPLIIALCFSCRATDNSVVNESVRVVKCSKVIVVDSLSTSATFAGRVDAEIEANVAFRIAGQIEKIEVVAGMFVREGDVVAVMDDRDYKTQLSATEAEYKGIKSHVDRVKELYKSESVSPSDYDKAIAAMDQIEAKKLAHTNALNDCKLRAPFDGYIQKINFEQGEMVAAGMSIVSMISNRASQIEINVPTSYYIRRGDYSSATAKIELLGDRDFDLKLIGTTPKANLSGLYSMRFNIVGKDQPSPGMIAMVTVNYNNCSASYAQIPVSAIVENSVWVVGGGKVSTKQIEIIELKSNGVALVDGLDSGETVVTAGVRSLKEGQKVEVMQSVGESNIGGLL